MKGNYTVIIAMIAYVMIGDSKSCLKNGAGNYISKPLTFNKFKGVLINIYNL